VTLWHGRFSEPTDAALWELSESFSFDRALWRHDLLGTVAHVHALSAAGLLSDAEAGELEVALNQIGEEFERGTFAVAPTDEDVHTAIERRATELAGAAGAKLHTGRSRNDQVATALRLFVRDALGDVVDDVLLLIEALDEVATAHGGVALAGYTHLQRAQPSTLAHHLRAHAWALTRDADRLLATRTRLNVSPLGAGALAGSSLAIDPAVAVGELGFARAFENSLDAVSDRDFVAESLFDLALIGVHGSRMGEEIVLWTSAEFAFATLSDAFSTGSSMLPHKKNADVAELSRGKTGRLTGNLVSVLTTLKGLPLSYNRDLQEDKEPLFDSLRQVRLVLRALAGAYRALTFDEAVTTAAANDPALVAIDLAEWLVARGVAFRTAHERVGRLVGEAARRHVSLQSLVAADDELAGANVLFIPGASLARRLTPGGPGSAAEGAQRDALEKAVTELRARRGAPLL
jgi:argininosuccinate lyase